MKVTSVAAAVVCVVVSTCLVGLSHQKVLDMSGSPDLRKDASVGRQELLGRSVNLSFFVPAFSIMQMMSQFMPQMFPSLTTTTSSRRRAKQVVLGDNNIGGVQKESIVEFKLPHVVVEGVNKE